MLLYGVIPGLLAGLLLVWAVKKSMLFPDVDLRKSENRILTILGFLSCTLIAGPVFMHFYALKYAKLGSAALWDQLIILGIPMILLQFFSLADKRVKNGLYQFILAGLFVIIFSVITPLLYNFIMVY